MKRRPSRANLLAVIGKLGFALFVFFATIAGWAYLRPAVIDRLPLPDNVARRDANRCAMWFVGSSTIARWSTLQHDIPDWQTHNRGIDGTHLDQVDARAQATDSVIPPVAIILYAGENDIDAGISAEVTAKAMSRLIGHMALRWPNVPMFVVALKPSPVRWHERPAQLRYNAIMRDIARERPGLWFIEAGDRLLTDGKPQPALYADGIHMNPTGYGIWSQDVREALERLMPAGPARRCATVSAMQGTKA